MGLPSGEVTFLFTDIEGSTRLSHALGTRYPAVLRTHLELIRGAIDAGGGSVVSQAGDGVFAAFPTATGALHAATTAQRHLDEHRWPDGHALRVRMGLHTADAHPDHDDYSGLAVHLAARVSAAAHGTQVLLTTATATAAGLAADSSLPLGSYQLRGFDEPVELLQLTDAGAPAVLAAPRAAPSRIPGIPTPRSSFVGRARELVDIHQLLSQQRLVTIAGPGGGGKTRLALELVRRQARRHTDGIRAVFLAGTAASDAAAAVAAAVDAEPAGDRIEDIAAAIATSIGEQDLLMLIDNCEHALPALVDLLTVAFDRCPGLTVLATSREPLRISTEQIYRVPPMDLHSGPDTATSGPSDAAALFLARAAILRPDLEWTDAALAAVTRICHRVEGLPLAIELAAARIAHLDPADLADRLDDHLGPLARADGRTGATTTLTATLAWSYELLDPPQRTLLDELSVFHTSFPLAAAAAIATPSPDGEDMLETLSALVDKSLVTAADSDGIPDYRLHVVVREFAAAGLREHGTPTRTLTRHADYHAQIAAAMSSRPRTEPLPGSHIRLVANAQPDLIAAYEWSLRHDELAKALTLGHGISRSLFRGGRLRESATWAHQTLAATHGQSRTDEYGWLLYTAIVADLRCGDDAAADQRVPDLLTLAATLEDENLLGGAWHIRADLLRRAGDFDAARTAYANALSHIRADAWRALVLGKLAFVDAVHGDLQAAIEGTRAEIAVATRLGDTGLAAQAMTSLADYAVAQHQPDAVHHVQTAYAAAVEAADVFEQRTAAATAAALQWANDDLPGAATTFGALDADLAHHDDHADTWIAAHGLLLSPLRAWTHLKPRLTVDPALALAFQAGAALPLDVAVSRACNPPQARQSPADR